MVRAAFIALLCVCVNACTALICPDGGMCEDGNTCCLTPSGGYGCCPLPHAECCSDHLHCCYQGTLCDLEHSKCVNKTHVLDWVEKVEAKLQAVVCPDGESECPDDTTCCQMPDGGWGCCPMKNAVCCDDRKHCCPQGTTCDLVHSMCVSATYGSSPFLRKFAARRRKPLEKNAVDLPAEVNNIREVICPDKISKCPEDTTCCLLETGSYGCCPMPKAVCCSDQKHCCPEGTTCDLIHSTCLSANGVSEMATKIPAVTVLKPKEEVVPCNETVACSSGTTCCKTPEGSWACCPLPKAVCCEDHIHCCPEGTLCNVAASSCDDPAELSVSVPWMEKVSTKPIAPPPNKKCDESSSCPGESTCCKLSSGDWGCCPLPEAVCCEDHVHCCPHGSVCNVAAETCETVSDSGLRISVPMVKKIPAVSVPSQKQNCDETSSCPTGTTCCKLTSNSWACCPVPQAVCCADQEHCCPQGYTCDLAQSSCVRSGLPSMAWFRKEPALRETQRVEDRHMCDAQTSCPRDDTCCFINRIGKWGCCPLPKAVCCKDGDHCCPSGYTCNEEKTSCTKGLHQIPWFTKKTARVWKSSDELLGHEDVKCDSSTSCPSGSTCCILPTGQWGCCPLVKAVCCEDHEHCCPQGYICKLELGTCEKASAGVSVSLTAVQMPEIQCDTFTRCAHTQSCCRLADSTWACCPYTQAVCCKDMKHCCPMGYKCDPKVQGCTKSSSSTWWNNSL